MEVAECRATRELRRVGSREASGGYAVLTVDEDSQDETESPVLSVAGTLYGLGFGAIFMAVGLAIAVGLTQNVGPRLEKYLGGNGYAYPQELRADAEARAAFPAALASWKVRDAARLEVAKTTLPAEVLADESSLATAMDALREKTDDWEPRDPREPLKPMPEKTWDRFAALRTSQRVALFKGLLVGPVFFLPGFFLAMSMMLSVFRERGARRLAREFPRRPWLHDDDWSQLRGSLRNANSIPGIAMMLGIFGWLALCATVSWVLDSERAWNFTLVMFVANLAATFIAVLAVRRVLQRIKFGQPQLLLAQVPIELGKTFSARLLMSSAVGGATTLRASLRLEKTTTSGIGKNKHTDLSVVCERSIEVPRSAFVEHEGGLSAELRFEVPDDVPLTRVTSEPSYEWLVAVKAETAGVDFDESFSVPVYRPQSDEEKTLRSPAA